MRRRLMAAGSGLAASAALLTLVSVCHPFARFFSNRVSMPIGRALHRLSSAASFPVFELLVMLALTVAAAALLSAVLRAAVRRRAEPLITFLANTLLLASVVVFTYVLTWPAQLYASPFADSVSFYESAYTTEDLNALCHSLIGRANGLISQVEQRNGRYVLPEDTESLLESVPGLVAGVALDDTTPNIPKLARYPEVFRALNIAGLYAPWTGESIVNPLEVEATIPFTACHEAAHSVGFAKEDDANFVAYLACMSGSADFQYSGALSALYYAMELLKAEDPALWLRARDAFAEDVYRDFYTMNGFRDAPVTETVKRNEEIADAFLRINGQNGLSSYPQMVLRILDYERGILLLN